VNDYLTNLAARSLESVPALQPRLRSRFEPAEQADAASPFTAAPPEIERETSASIAAQPHRVATADRDAQPDSPPPTIAEPKKIEASAPPAAQKNNDETPHQPEPTPREQTAQTVIRERTVISEVVHRREPRPRSIQTRAAEIEPHPSASEQVTAPSPVIALPPVTPLFEDRGEDHFTREGKQPSVPAPTIQVTIGRIEVRATPPPSSPKPRATRATLSLDDYLHRRGTGGER